MVPSAHHPALLLTQCGMLVTDSADDSSVGVAIDVPSTEPSALYLETMPE